MSNETKYDVLIKDNNIEPTSINYMYNVSVIDPYECPFMS